MTKTEISKQLAEQENKARLTSQASRLDTLRQDDTERLAHLAEQMARLAETMDTMTREAQVQLRQVDQSVRTLTREVETTLTQAKEADSEMRRATSGITWKMGAGMCLAAILAAPATVSVYLNWQHHSGEEKAQAEAWKSFKEQINSLNPVEQQRLLKILHWDQKK